MLAFRFWEAWSSVSNEAPVKRRLAAILAADVVGYSKLIGEDETSTLAILREIRREIVNPILYEHGGRIFKLMGDGYSPSSRAPFKRYALPLASSSGWASVMPMPRLAD